MKKFTFLSLLSLLSVASFAQDGAIKSYETSMVTIRSTKESDQLEKSATAATVISTSSITQRGLESVKELTALAPSLYIPDYGSKKSTPIYLRGIGTRSGGQSVAIYKDGIPQLSGSSIDFELFDIASIEILRAPQGTLYGRNAMSGVINIYTLSPLDYQGTKVSGSYGSQNLIDVKGSHYTKIGKNFGLAVGAYYNQCDGYFINEYSGKHGDEELGAGGRIRADWMINPSLKMVLESSFDYSNQGAFPYAIIDPESGEIGDVNYDYEGKYKRNLSNSSLKIEYTKKGMLFSSATGFQYLKDSMNMDQDFTAAPVFEIIQKQNQKSLSQEFALRSLNDKNYQWSVGAFGFYDHLDTDVDVKFKEFGVAAIQSSFDKMGANPAMPKIKVADKTLLNPSLFETPAAGAALFHQSTFNNLITKGLSLTIGARVDYEKQWIDYCSSMAMNMDVDFAGRPTLAVPVGVKLEDKLSHEFWQFLPKFALKYETQSGVVNYATISKGYKTGGYNTQLFSDITQTELQLGAMNALMPLIMPNYDSSNQPKTDYSSMLEYSPEISWNYEVGVKGKLFNGVLNSDIALFYMDVQDIQLTKFVNSGQGRVLSNGGEGRVAGCEVALSTSAINNLNLSVNYGYNNAKFTSYDGGENKQGEKEDYSGNFIPYTPSHTFSASGLYVIPLKSDFIKQVAISLSYEGVGKIYWTEANDVIQPYYGTLNSKISLYHKAARLELWARNITNEEYGVFYFESMGNSIVQKGKPVNFGATIAFNL